VKGRGCLVIRWGAYGDLLFTLPLFEHLKRKYGYLHLETTKQGKELFRDNPTFDAITSFDIFDFPEHERTGVSFLRWSAMENCDWEHTINTWRSLEYLCAVEEYQPEYSWPREKRRAKFDIPYHEGPWIVAKETIPEPFDCGTFHFSPDNVWWMKSWKERHRDEFIIAMPMGGSTHQKQPVGLKEVAREILDTYPTAKIFLLGDAKGRDREFAFGDGRVCQMCGTASILHAIAITKMADYVIGAESSLTVAAGMFGTPKTAICTASSVQQVTKYHKNDFSIQATTSCSPCLRAVYKTDWCLMRDFGSGEVPACNGEWETGRIMEGVKFAWECKLSGVRGKVEQFDGPGFGSLPEMQPLLDCKENRHEEI
jgi:ADP-heptose:LPS heptosyltransferase